MKKHLLLFVAMIWLSIIGAGAEVFTTSPTPLQQSSQDVKIYFNAQESGVAALQSASELYAHIGVLLEGSTSWSHVKTGWSENTDANRFVKQSDGLWMLSIGDINTYFNIASGEKVAKIAIIARTANGAAQTKDYFIDVAEEGFAINFSYNTESLVISAATTITFSLSSTQAANLSIAVDGQVIESASNATSISKAYNFNTEGKFYEVVATANNGSETLTETVTVAYPTASAQANYPGGVPKMGAIKQTDGSVIFCLAAPSKKSVIIVPSWDNYQTLNKNVMKYQDYNGYRYFWIQISGLDNNKYYPYYYLVDGSIKVADPCAKLMLDVNSDKWMPSGIWAEEMPQYPYDIMDDTMLAVYRGDIDDYNWDSATTNFQIPDKKSMVVYEILLRDFTGDGSDSDGKHYGTLRTAMPRLQYIADLGVNVVELMPIMEFNGNSSWGYNTNGYMALDKIYGSPKDLKDFVAACHRLGMAVVLDIVFNQSDGLHPWYQMYPVGSNPFYNATAPHDYSVLNDFRQDYPLVEEHWGDVIRYWMQAYKVDGFRFDLVKGLGDNDSYGSGTEAYNSSRVNRMKRLNDIIKSVNPNGIHINELLGQNSEENANANNGEMGWNNVNYGSCQYAMGFAASSEDTKGFYSPNWSKTLGGTVDYAESHDEERMAGKIKQYGHASVKYSTSSPKKAAIQRLGSVAAQMLMSPGAKMIWEFGEIAADDAMGSDTEKLRAIAPKWDQMTDEGRSALHDNYQALCWLRKDNPELFNGSATYSYSGFAGSLTSNRYIRLINGDKEVIAVFNPNVTGSSVNISVPVQKISASNNQLITAAYGFEPSLSVNGSTATISVPAHSFAVYASNAVAGVEDINADFAKSVNVYGSNGRIVIDGDYNTVEIFDLQGRVSNSLDVPAGVYVVRVDGETFKVVVR
jgi:1,4-alpha-glucan branching enzyme